jgi:hypothetical protein
MLGWVFFQEAKFSPSSSSLRHGGTKGRTGKETTKTEMMAKARQCFFFDSANRSVNRGSGGGGTRRSLATRDVSGRYAYSYFSCTRSRTSARKYMNRVLVSTDAHVGTAATPAMVLRVALELV